MPALPPTAVQRNRLDVLLSTFLHPQQPFRSLQIVTFRFPLWRSGAGMDVGRTVLPDMIRD